jgi:hypothetical protein
MDTTTRHVCESILPPGVALQEGEPPPAPTSFGAQLLLFANPSAVRRAA